jgi:hypothetical protein
VGSGARTIDIKVPVASIVCMLLVEVKAALQHMVISDKWSIYKEDAPANGGRKFTKMGVHTFLICI